MKQLFHFILIMTLKYNYYVPHYFNHKSILLSEDCVREAGEGKIRNQPPKDIGNLHLAYKQSIIPFSKSNWNRRDQLDQRSHGNQKQHISR